MPRKLTYEEKFERFKKEFNHLWIRDLALFCEMSDKWQAIKVGLIKEKKEQFKDGE
jgi:hypothetical protein